MRRPAAILELCALALLALAAPARAQRAVVLDFDGDAGGKLRTQVVEALAAAGKVALVPSRDFKSAALRKGFSTSRKDPRDMIRAVAKPLGLDAVVDGAVRSGELHVVIYDPAGAELWSRDIPLRRARLDEETAQRLAAAIAAATAPAPAEPPPPPLRTIPPDTTAGTGTAGTGTATGTTTTGTATRPPPPPPPPRPEPPRENPPAYEANLPPAFEELPRPDLVRFTLSGHTLWRNYCARPAVTSCREWSTLDPRPTGETQDFISDIPYSGVLAELEAFPLAPVQNPWVSGIGFGGSYGAGFSLTTVRVSTPTSTTDEKQVLSTDTSFSAHAMYRVHFAVGGPRFWSYAGARLGVQGRLFNVDPQAVEPVAGSHRVYAYAGLDFGMKLTPLIDVEAGVWYLFDPHAGQEDLVPYGTSVTAVGLGAELGVRGDLWGPVGYSVRGHFSGYGDRFSGAGLRWAQGGAAEEIYLSVSWGLFVKY